MSTPRLRLEILWIHFESAFWEPQIVWICSNNSGKSINVESSMDFIDVNVSWKSVLFLFKITIHTSYIVRTIHRNGKGSEFTLCSVFCYQEIFTDLITNLTSGQWRVRLSCCVALADFLRAGGAKVFDVSYVNTRTMYFIFLKINHGGTRCLKEEKKTKKKQRSWNRSLSPRRIGLITDNELNWRVCTKNYCTWNLWLENANWNSFHSE